MTPADFIADFPAFTDVPVPQIQAKINLSAKYFLNVGRWGDFLIEAQENWIAHKLTLDLINAANPAGVALSGDITEKRVGSVSVSRGAALLEKEMDNPYLLTPYGREYWRLLKQQGMGSVAV